MLHQIRLRPRHAAASTYPAYIVNKLMVKTEKPYSVLPFPVTTGLHSITHHDISLLILIVFLICSVTFTLFIQLWTVQTEYKFHRPYFVNTIQLAVSLVPLLYAARKAVLVNSFRPRSTMGIIAVHVGILTLNAIFVTHIPVTRLHTLHALSIPFAWILSRNSCRRHWGISLSCAVYCVGAWLAGTGRPPLAATAIGVVYAALLALYSVLVKRNLEHTDLWYVIYISFAFSSDMAEYGLYRCLLTYQTGVSLLAMVPVTLISGELAQPLPYFVTDAGFWFQMVQVSKGRGRRKHFCLYTCIFIDCYGSDGAFYQRMCNVFDPTYITHDTSNGCRDKGRQQCFGNPN